MTEVEILKAKVNNLEILCLGLIALNDDLLPPTVSSDIGKLASDFFESNNCINNAGEFILVEPPITEDK